MQTFLLLMSIKFVSALLAFNLQLAYQLLKYKVKGLILENTLINKMLAAR